MSTPEPDLATVGARIRDAIRHVHWSMPDVAKIAGIDITAMRRAMRGERALSSLEMARLAKAVLTTPEELLGLPAPGPRLTACAQRPIARTNPPAHVRAILGRRNPRLVEVIAEVPAGLEDAAVDAMLGALDEYGIGGAGSSAPADEYYDRIAQEDADAKELEQLREFGDWLISLDGEDAASIYERAAVTLPDIIDQARKARGQENHSG